MLQDFVLHSFFILQDSIFSYGIFFLLLLMQVSNNPSFFFESTQIQAWSPAHTYVLARIAWKSQFLSEVMSCLCGLGLLKQLKVLKESGNDCRPQLFTKKTDDIPNFLI